MRFFKFAILFLFLALSFLLINGFVFQIKKHKPKERLCKSKLLTKNKCQILRNDMPKRMFYLFDKDSALIYNKQTYCKLIFGCNVKNESEITYINMDFANGVSLIEKSEKGNYIEYNFLNFSDTTLRRIENKHFKKYHYKLSDTYLTKGDSIFVFKFSLNKAVISQSHECFLPLNEIHVSKKFGIQKVVVEDYCFRVDYE